MVASKNNEGKAQKVFFYIPGLESVNVLYFLANKYSNNLIIITTSISIHKVCEIIGLKYINPEYFRQKTESKIIKNLRNYNINNISLASNLAIKAMELLKLIVAIYRAKEVVDTLEPGSKLYYSTFFVDVLGILFLRMALEKKTTEVRLIWPSSIRFTEFSPPTIFKVTFWINILTKGLFALHKYPSGGVFIGINPEYLEKKRVQFVYDDHAAAFLPSNKYIERAKSLIEIRCAKRPKILFLGEYSVENGVAYYGDIYLKLIELFSNLKSIDVYYKPHPMYNSISHSSLKSILILDTQIPVELLDDGSWLYIVGFYTASLVTKKTSRCICLLELEEIQSVTNHNLKLRKLMKESRNKLIYPKNLESLRSILQCT